MRGALLVQLVAARGHRDRETRSVIRTSPPARNSWISRTLQAVNSEGLVALGPLACFAREPTWHHPARGQFSQQIRCQA